MFISFQLIKKELNFAVKINFVFVFSFPRSTFVSTTLHATPSHASEHLVRQLFFLRHSVKCYQVSRLRMNNSTRVGGLKLLLHCSISPIFAALTDEQNLLTYKGSKKKKLQLIDFNGMSTRLELYYAKRFCNRVHWRFIVTFCWAVS